MVTYHVGSQSLLESRLDPSLIMTHDEFVTSDLAMNVFWEEVTVRCEDDFLEWLELKNAWLEACWTSNQNWEERMSNAKRAISLERQMKELVVKDWEKE